MAFGKTKGFFTATVVGQKELNKRLGKILDRVDDLRPIFLVIGADIQQIVFKHFADEMGPTGKWLQFAAIRRNQITKKITRGGKEITVYAQKRGSGQPVTNASKLLRDTGHLRNSIQILRNLAKELAVGTTVKYAGTHQFGNPKKNIPARPYIWLADEDVDSIVKAMSDWIMKGGSR